MIDLDPKQRLIQTTSGNNRLSHHLPDECHHRLSIDYVVNSALAHSVETLNEKKNIYIYM